MRLLKPQKMMNNSSPPPHFLVPFLLGLNPSLFPQHILLQTNPLSQVPTTLPLLFSLSLQVLTRLGLALKLGRGILARDSHRKSTAQTTTEGAKQRTTIKRFCETSKLGQAAEWNGTKLEKKEGLPAGNREIAMAVSAGA